MTKPTTEASERWLTPGVRGIGTASFLADVGHEIPTALLPNLLTATLGAPAAALGLIEGVSDGLAGAARLAGGAIADDPRRRRAQAVAGYTATAVLSSLIGAATNVWQVAVLRADTSMFVALLDDVPPIGTPSGRRRTRPAAVHADKGATTARQPRLAAAAWDQAADRSAWGGVIDPAGAASVEGGAGAVVAELL